MEAREEKSNRNNFVKKEKAMEGTGILAPKERKPTQG